MTQVQLVFVIQSTIAQILTLQSFKVLRVLGLEGCDLSQCYILEFIALEIPGPKQHKNL